MSDVNVSRDTIRLRHPAQLRRMHRRISHRDAFAGTRNTFPGANVPIPSYLRHSGLLYSSKPFRNILKEHHKNDKQKVDNKQQTLISKITEFMKHSVGDGGFRAAIFGLSDGLATNLCLIIGIQFAVMNDHDLNEIKVHNEIIRTGIAGIFGGALSMALGEYISMSAQSEALLSEIEKHSDALENEWDEEMDVLREILSKTLSEDTIDKIMDDFAFAERADVLELNAKISLGIDPDDIGSGVISASWSFVMFSIGGIVPLSPYFLTTSITQGAVFSILVSLIISVFIGYLIGVLSNTSRSKTTLRQFTGTIIGVMCSMIINWLFNA